MGLIQRIFGGGAPSRHSPPSSQMHAPSSQSSPSQQFANSQGNTRRELLRVVLRETLHRQGIPAGWIAAETLNTSSRTGERTVHWRLHIKHWDVRLLNHSVALQQALIKRLMSFDPMASAWLSGISWQFALEDESMCAPLPHPGSWTSEPHQAGKPAPEGAVVGGAGDVIAGPVTISAPVAAGRRDAKAEREDLNELLAMRDEDFRKHAASAAGRTWAVTEPAKLTEPGKLSRA